MADEQSPTVGIIIIGDEILKGQTKDSNSYFIAKRMWSLGVKVCKISVVADDENDIIHEVREFSSKFTFVITTGGIGPTHDDITIPSIAKAFDESLIHSENLVDTIASIYHIDRSDLNEFQLKMASLPSSADLVYSKNMQDNPFPVIRVHNVFVFPGVPDFLEKDFHSIEHVFAHPSRKEFHLCTIYLSAGEAEIAHILDEVHQRYKETVKLGSYPDFCSQEFKVKLTVESESKDQLEDAFECLMNKLPQASIVKIEGAISPLKQPDTTNSQSVPHISKMHSLLSSDNSSNISACVKGAWAIIQEVLRQYSLDEICLSFNGGKDCTVLLYLIYAAVLQNFGKIPNFNALYIEYESPFPEAEAFIKETKQRYNLNLITSKGTIKTALKKLKTSHPNIKAILLGTRRHDPFTEKLHAFSCTDPDWPKYMRVNPILDWHHKDVWEVLLHFPIAYCSLYDKGYTSLGNTHNTKPNPTLTIDGLNYKPAYMLEDDHQERAGRKELS